MSEGIKESSIAQREEAFGSNAPPEAKVKSCIMLFIEALNDLTLIVLIIAAVVSLIINLLTTDHKDLGKA